MVNECAGLVWADSHLPVYRGSPSSSRCPVWVPCHPPTNATQTHTIISTSSLAASLLPVLIAGLVTWPCAHVGSLEHGRVHEAPPRLTYLPRPPASATGLLIRTIHLITS